MRQIIKKRYEQFIEKQGGDASDIKDFSEFLAHLYDDEDPREILSEDDQFQAYQNYRTFRKKSKTDDEVFNIFDRTWQYLYRKKGFKKVTSRKSLNYIHDWIYIQKGNVYGIVYGVGPDGFGGIETSFLGLEEICSTRDLSRTYILRGIVEKGSEDFDILFTGHFFDRYAERTNLGYNDRDKVIEAFMRAEFEGSLNGCGISTNDDNFHCSLPTQTGLCLGHSIKTIRLFKTFVHGDQLGKQQILEALNNGAQRHQRIQEHEKENTGSDLNNMIFR